MLVPPSEALRHVRVVWKRLRESGSHRGFEGGLSLPKDWRVTDRPRPECRTLAVRPTPKTRWVGRVEERHGSYSRWLLSPATGWVGFCPLRFSPQGIQPYPKGASAGTSVAERTSKGALGTRPVAKGVTGKTNGSTFHD